MQKLVLGIALATMCVATPSWAAEGDAQQEQGAEATDATEENASEEGGDLLGFPPKKPAQTEEDGTTPSEGNAAAVGGSTDTGASSVNAPRKSLTDQATSTLTKNVLLQREQSVRTKRFGLIATMSTFAGSATFIDNSFVRHQNDYVAQIFDFRPTFGFNVADHRLRLSGRFAFETEYTQPNTNPSRRWKPYDSSIAIADDTLFKEPVTGILFNAALRFTLPTSYESINVRQQWLATGLTLGARRLVGEFQLSYTSSVTKYFNGSKTAVRTIDTPRGGDDGRETSDVARPRVAETTDINAGYTNNSWLFVNNAGVTWLFNDHLAFSYWFGLLSFIKYAPGNTSQFTSINADNEHPTRQQFQTGIEASYDLSHYSKEQWGLPFSLTIALGLQVTTPLQTADNNGVIPPLIFNAFTDRAANNYGSVYMDLVAIY